jgi:DNA-binding CsgD family transcriptional regulator
MISAIAAWNCKRQDEAFLAFDTATELLQKHGLRSVLRSFPYDMLLELATAAQAAGINDIVATIEAIPEVLRSRRYERLTEMELRTLAAIAEHRSANQAAAALFITAGTVKKHLASVYRKLRVNGLIGIQGVAVP